MLNTTDLTPQDVIVLRAYTWLFKWLQLCGVSYIYDIVSECCLYNLSLRAQYYHCHTNGGISSSHLRGWYDSGNRSVNILTSNVESIARFHSY